MSKLREDENEPVEIKPCVDDTPEPRDTNRPRLLRYPFGESPLERGIPPVYR